MQQYMQNPLSQLTIRLEAHNIPRSDVASQSDPFAVLRTVSGGVAAPVDRTEIVWNQPNPQWVKGFDVPYFFNVMQQLTVEVYDADSKDTSDLSKHDFIGRATVCLSELVCAPMMTMRVALSGGPAPRGEFPEITIRAEDGAAGGSASLAMHLKAKGTGLGKRKILFYRAVEGAGERGLPIASFESGSDGKIGVATLVGNDPTRNISIEVHKPVLGKADKCFAVGQVSAQELVQLGEGACGRTTIECYAPGKVGARPKPAGEVTLSNIIKTETPSFMDYLRSGLDLSLNIAIDFTGSNGVPTDRNSLHYVFAQPPKPTAYAYALEAVANVLLPYDSDRAVPVFGFGANITGTFGVNHLFPMDPTGNFQNVPCHSVPEMMQAYYTSVPRLGFAGPTNFAPFLRHLRQAATAAADTARAGGPLNFQVGLIITDGAITDMRDTIDEVVALSALPAALIIVGVGSADFSSMEALDADTKPLYSRTGQKAMADIVQFVPYNEYARQGPACLAAAVLEEIPNQVADWFTKNKIFPRPVAPTSVIAPAPQGMPAQQTSPSFIVN